MIRFACIYCGVKFAVQPSSAGKMIKCHGCEKRVGVPLPERAAVVEDLDDVELVDDDEDVPVAKVVDTRPKPKPPKPKERKPTLVAEGLNCTVTLIGTELIFDHDGTFSGHGRAIRPGVYRQPVLALTALELAEASLFNNGSIRFIFGNERLDADVASVLDTCTVEFDYSMALEFENFRVEVERFRRRLIAEIRMNNNR